MMIRTIKLSSGQTALIDADDWHLVESLTFHLDHYGYPRCNLRGGGTKTLHLLLMGTRSGLHVDHANGNKLDNRRSNLRFVTPQRNQINRHKMNRRNATGVRGVTWIGSFSPRNPWRAKIMVDYVEIHLGVFPTQEKAAEARRAAELHYYGEFCPT